MEKNVNVNKRFCDCCEKEIDDAPHYHWEERDFDLCFNCIEKLYINAFKPPRKAARQRELG